MIDQLGKPSNIRDDIPKKAAVLLDFVQITSPLPNPYGQPDRKIFVFYDFPKETGFSFIFCETKLISEKKISFSRNK